MSLNPKVVPFDRGADFVHQRAKKNQRENNLVEALELMRKAVAQSPDNETYAMDLAELLSETGCRASANRLLLDMLAKGKNADRCLYDLAVNMLSSNDPEGAKRLLKLCADRGESPEYRDQARALSGEIEMYETLNRPASRRQERMLSMSDAACEKLRVGDVEGARRLFQRVLEKDETQRDVQALMAMACIMSGESAAAVAHAERAVIEPGTTLRALCVSAQVYAMAGDEKSMRAALETAREMGADGPDCYMLVFSLFEAGMFAEARDEALMALRETPYDRLLMHVVALCILNLGESKESAIKYWQRIVRIDPDDTVASYFLNAAENDTLDLSQISCEYQVPHGEILARFRYLTEKLTTDYDTLSDQWRSDPKFRAIIGWCLMADDLRFRELAVTMISSFDDAAAESMLREYMTRPDAGPDMTMRAAAVYQMRGRDIGRILPLDRGLEDALMPDGRRILEGMSVGHRQLVRLADDVLRQRYDIDAYDRLSLIWDVYRRGTSPKSDPMTATETAAAALAYCYLEISGHEPSVYTLSAQFRCPVRQLKYYVRHLSAVLERGGAPIGRAD